MELLPLVFTNGFDNIQSVINFFVILDHRHRILILVKISI